MVTRVLLAPLAFKGSLGAVDVAAAMADGVAAVSSSLAVELRPMADGGDGSIDALASAGFTRIPISAHGPTGQPVDAAIAVRDDVAVVELAGTCGMSRLPDGRLAPLAASTVGLGEAIRAALDRSPRQIVVCLGGSASTDGGAGLLSALGARLLDGRGREVMPSGGTLVEILDLDLTGLDPRLRDVDIIIAADVTAPLLGPGGAAAVFAPQKGASPAQVAHLEAGLSSWRAVLEGATGRGVADVPGAGAAGGTASALLAVFGADIRSGAELIAAETGLADAMARCDVVITGEGRLDDQTSLGKGAGRVAHLAGESGRPVLAVCGAIDLDPVQLRALGFSAWADCRSLAEDDAQSIRQARHLVARATEEVLGDVLPDGTPGSA